MKGGCRSPMRTALSVNLSTGRAGLVLASLDSAKRGDHLGCEQFEMRLSPSRWQSGRQRPRREVCDGDIVGEVANQFYRGVGVDHLEKPASPQLLTIAQMLGKGTKSSRRKPC